MPGEIQLQWYSKKSFYYKILKAIGNKFFNWWQSHITEYLLSIDIIYPINTKIYPSWQKGHNILFKGSMHLISFSEGKKVCTENHWARC